MTLVIKNGTLVLPDGLKRADLCVADGKIAEIGACPGGARTFDASDCLVFPGFIDGHTHLEMETGSLVTADDFPSGSAAALSGGTTTIVDFATQERGGTLSAALRERQARAAGRCACDYGFHMAVTDWNDRAWEELAAIRDAGVTSVKAYLAYDALRLRDDALYSLLRRTAELGILTGAHCENGDLVNALVDEARRAGRLAPRFHPQTRPPCVEAEAVRRFLTIAALAGDAPVYVVHLSTAEGLAEIRRARARGQRRVFAETCPQYLTLEEALYEAPGFEGAKYVCSPPLRGKEDRDALWQGVERGEIGMVSTDHCSYNFKGQKELGRQDFSKIPGGLPAIEHRPALLYSEGVGAERITPVQMARLLSEEQARRFGLFPQKGALLPGADADLVVWDPHWRGVISAERQTMRADYSPWEGTAVRGRARAVFLRGELVAEEGAVLRGDSGVYLKRRLTET